MTKLALKYLLIAVSVLSACAISYAQTTSPTIAEPSLERPAETDSQTLKALEIANIRLNAANETIKLLNDRLTAKDEIIKAKEGTIAVRDEQLALAKSANTDRAAVNNGDARMLQACENQLAKAEARIFSLENPGLLKRVFNPDGLFKFAVGYGAGKLTK